MILLLDAGNSFIKWAWLKPDWLQRKQNGLPELEQAGECLHAGENLIATLDEAWSALAKPDQVWLSNVAGDELQTGIQDWISQHWGCAVSIAVTQARSGSVINAYTDPAQMGIDRWLGLLAANASGTGPRAVIDCGTAITVDALSAAGQHLGGLILPGLKMMRDSLYRRAEGVAETEMTQPAQGMLFANNTRTAVEVGCHYSVVAFVERIMGDMKKELGSGLRCLLTGGDVEEIEPLLSVEVERYDLLVLQGLAIYAHRNS